MLRWQDTSVTICGKMLLAPCQLELVEGQVTLVLGPNGAGKSTLLRLASGDLSPTSGSVLLDDKVLQQWPARLLARRRAVHLAAAGVPFAFTAMQIVAMGRYPYQGHSTRSLDDMTIREAMQAMDVEHLAHEAYSHLSSGERQRVQLARLLAQVANDRGEAAVILLDEPLTALDLAHKVKVLARLRELADQGHAVLLVEHDLNMAASIADRVVLMKQGRVMAQGGRDEVMQPEMLERCFDVNLVALSGARQAFYMPEQIALPKA